MTSKKGKFGGNQSPVSPSEEQYGGAQRKHYFSSRSPKSPVSPSDEHGQPKKNQNFFNKAISPKSPTESKSGNSFGSGAYVPPSLRREDK